MFPVSVAVKARDACQGDGAVADAVNQP